MQVLGTTGWLIVWQVGQHPTTVLKWKTIKTILPKMQGEAGTDFECRTHHQRLLERERSDKEQPHQLEMGGRESGVHNQCVIGSVREHTLKTILSLLWVTRGNVPCEKETHHLVSIKA